MLSAIRWNAATADSNRMQHDVRFEEAWTLFFDPHHATIEVGTPSADEATFVAVGRSVEGAILATRYAIRSDEVHLLAARAATHMERRHYMNRDESEADGMAAEHDFSRGVRGRHFIKPEGPINVTIDPVVAEYFPDEQAVNDALRVLIVEGRATRRV